MRRRHAVLAAANADAGWPQLREASCYTPRCRALCTAAGRAHLVAWLYVRRSPSRPPCAARLGLRLMSRPRPRRARVDARRALDTIPSRRGLYEKLGYRVTAPSRTARRPCALQHGQAFPLNPSQPCLPPAHGCQARRSRRHVRPDRKIAVVPGATGGNASHRHRPACPGCDQSQSPAGARRNSPAGAALDGDR